MTLGQLLWYMAKLVISFFVGAVGYSVLFYLVYGTEGADMSALGWGVAGMIVFWIVSELIPRVMNERK